MEKVLTGEEGLRDVFGGLHLAVEPWHGGDALGEEDGGDDGELHCEGEIGKCYE